MYKFFQMSAPAVGPALGAGAAHGAGRLQVSRADLAGPDIQSSLASMGPSHSQDTDRRLGEYLLGGHREGTPTLL